MVIDQCRIEKILTRLILALKIFIVAFLDKAKAQQDKLGTLQNLKNYTEQKHIHMWHSKISTCSSFIGDTDMNKAVVKH